MFLTNIRLCSQVIIENSGMLMFISNSYKVQNMCDNAVDNYAHTLGSVPDCYKTQKSCQYLSFCNTFCS